MELSMEIEKLNLTQDTSLNIIDLCDDVILHIFSFLGHSDLSKMSQVCTKLFRISQDRTLWKHVNFNSFDRSMEDTYMSYIWEDLTTRVSINGQGTPNCRHSVSQKFMHNLRNKCQNLTHLYLCYQQLNNRLLIMNQFHEKLKFLKIDHSMADSYIYRFPNIHHYIFKLNFVCPNLEDVRLTFNDWVNPQTIDELYSLKKLTYLSLQGCDELICYELELINCIMNDGFKYLQTLDLRLTPVSDYELRMFVKLRNLKCILLECPTYMRHNTIETITDDGLLVFCYSILEIKEAKFPIRFGNNNINICGFLPEHVICKLEYLCVRNYPKVTDLFLTMETGNSSSSLKTLCLTGTSCTPDGIEKYKKLRSNVEVIY